MSIQRVTSSQLVCLSLLPMMALLACGPKQAQPQAAGDATAQAGVPVAGAAAAGAAVAADLDALIRSAAATDVLASMDTSADPCTDFYRYACGSWVDDTQRPSDQAAWFRSFSVISEHNREVMRDLLEQAAADPSAGGPAGSTPAADAAGDWQRLGNLYGSCMDIDAVDAAGLAPVQPLLDQIATIDSVDQVPAVIGKLQAAGVSPFFDLERWGDLKNPDMTSAYASQGGLGLPDRDYYLKDDEASVALQAAYRSFVAGFLELSGTDATQAAADADAIYAFEKALADFSLPKADLRDPEKTYNPTDAAGLDALAPQLGFATLAAELGLTLEQPLILHDTAWFGKLGDLVAATDPATLRSYLRFNVLLSAAGFLPDAYDQATFDFYGLQVYGQPQRKDRWKRCVDFANGNLGDALGRYYVETNFPGDSKAIAVGMVHDIQAAFTQSLPALDWMDDATRQAANEKSAAISDKIGYPDTWLDTSTMKISAQTFGANALAARRFHVHRDMAKVGQPVDPTEWFMSAPAVNAYYNPTENEIVFPAGILQPPFFSRAFPAALNYGSMGAVIGHELTHGFDDEGRKFDKDGQLREWWAADVATRFEERAQCVIDQYDGFELADGTHVNGSLTTGENIADLGGVKLAWSAYKARTAADAVAQTPFVEGLTNDQLFFVAYAQDWCSLVSPELEKMLVTVDPHSPGRFRVMGPLQNVPAFHEAFSCQAGQPMAPEASCQVW